MSSNPLPKPQYADVIDALRAEIERLRQREMVESEAAVQAAEAAEQYRAENERLRAALEVLLGECCDRHGRGYPCHNVCHAQAQQALANDKRAG